MKRLIVSLILILLASPAVAAGLDEKFYGNYVGSGVAENLEEGITEQRDLDVTIEPYKKNAFSFSIRRNEICKPFSVNLRR